MLSLKTLARATTVAAFAVALSAPAFAATETRINDDALAPLRGATIERRVRLEKLQLSHGKSSVIDLEEFKVWSPGAKVIVHGDNGVVVRVEDPPPMRFFRGIVDGDPQSFAYFSVDQRTLRIDGLVDVNGKRLAIGARKRLKTLPADQTFDYFISDAGENDAAASTGEPWECAVGDMRIHKPLPPRAMSANGLPIAAQGISGTQAYALDIEVETDNELFVLAGSSGANLTTFVANLTGAVSTIYNRDLKTNVTLRNLHQQVSVSDPWSAVAADTGLLELGDYYHTNHSGPLGSAVVFLSGKATFSGIAWEAIIGQGDFLCSGNCGNPAYDGHYAGPYAWCGSVVTGTVPNPNNAGPPLYRMPGSNYWSLAEYAHELGHVLAGHHTHCVTITPTEFIAAGFADGGRPGNFVDHCYGGECFSGMNYVPGAEGVFKGTIMSYCHNISPGGTASRYTFGQAAEPSHHELDDYMMNPSFVTGTNIITAVGAFTISAISGPATVGPNSTGNTASITAIPSTGATYRWDIINGTITSAVNTASITYTAGASGSVILRATAFQPSPSGVGVSDTKTVAIGATIAAPTGVVAAATSATNIQVTWNSVIGAVSYQVFRNDGTSGYVQVGTPAGTTFNNTVTTGKSYLYRVRAVDAGSSASADSAADFATAIAYTNTLTAGSSVIKAVDLSELRQAVSAMRVLANQGLTTFANPTITPGVTLIHAVDITELRGFLNGARTALGFGNATFGQTITAGSTKVAAADFNEIRAGAQ